MVTRRDGAEYCSKWHPPSPGAFKCNSDAAVFAAEGRTGAGIVLRDHRGRIVKHQRVSWPGVWSSNEAEAKAALEAFSWLEREGYQNVTLEVDAEQVVTAINSHEADASEFGEIIYGCTAIMNRNPSFCVCSVRRERNGVAHVFARHSISCSTPVEGTTSPAFVDDVLLELCPIRHD
ncbi:hypothetical protein LINPERHAP2_LOCUS34165 [Linum perenne]